MTKTPFWERYVFFFDSVTPKMEAPASLKGRKLFVISHGVIFRETLYLMKD
jgi:hypothetical protein